MTITKGEIKSIEIEGIGEVYKKVDSGEVSKDEAREILINVFKHVKKENQKLKELLREYQYEDQQAEFDVLSVCRSCGEYDFRDCKPDCEVKEALK